MLIEDMDDVIKQITRLRNIGFKFSIDDFGTGYSSLAYLHTFPIDELKIDKSFVDKINESQDGTAIVDAIIALSNHLNFNVIAEGVETHEQANILSKRQIKGMQGFFFARPMPAFEFMNWLNQNS
jgi:sensor c-di-GMP phosphodiesterase-like protein